VVDVGRDHGSASGSTRCAGALEPFVDTTPPWVEQLRAEADGRPAPATAAQGSVDLIVEAYDETPIVAPGRWGGKAVTPALTGAARFPIRVANLLRV
jgi:hypothetical protein